MIDADDLPPDSEPDEASSTAADAHSLENTGEIVTDEPAAQESMSQPAEHTGEPAEIQAKDALDADPEGSEIEQVSADSSLDDPAPEPLTLPQALEMKLKSVSDEMSEKEKLMMATVDHNIPEPYYESWRTDVNQHFSLIVRLNKRRRKLDDAS